MSSVFVIDDSAVVRQAMVAMLDGDAGIELAGTAPNPLIAAPLIRKKRPDVLLLDIEMPGMDGLTFLRQQMAEAPIPTVICSSLSTEGSRIALDALAAGAVAIVAKPKLGLRQFLEDSRRELISTLKAAALSRPRMPKPRPLSTLPVRTPSMRGPHALSVNKPVVIGSSTGGTQAIEQILRALPADAPGIAIVQHMPERFTAMFAERLDGLCAMQVREARDGDRLERGIVLVAPGGKHMKLRKAGGQYFAVVLDGPPVNRHKPSVDVLFRSLCEHTNGDALAIMLTGMGDDGARGMKQLHELGVRTLAQDEASCVVFGMPMEAIKLGAVDEVLPLDAMADAVTCFDARG
ncbi:chemotaxis response regulator protein-glutamate methylesterase [Roseateles sp. SL47]|jgi:two-component system, chemotaxis family, protein-glutamate methylesterase/glutaminase|uniref:protein-glutamate methylesterase/protein-glutamine glutaminase n=1 Tax=Roseateles sp. SL47 TaxID=2995138 RepID=UPI002270B08C|nr:chemotaxis response regulator protein-glutamate methylesterase [Roseateles sp. SL47]WAC71744.1 chemotaxis response regulator protein-glutamate methylesterase [Roseateles sp. SL47]